MSAVQPAAIIDQLKLSWKPLMFAGIVSVIAGFVSIVLPPLAGLAAAAFVGWILVFAGVGMAIDAFSVKAGAARTIGRLLLAIITIVAGLFIAFNLIEGLLTLTFVLCVVFVSNGIIRLAVGFRERGHPGAGMVVFSGILGIVIGFMILAEFPESAAWAVGLLVGIDLVFFGFAAIAAANAGKQAAKATPAAPAGA
ncbi:MAG: hypothetical protein QOG62_2166 [Thermoleophilaceae bacterium]|jgi:uncharacterized membrane protein HdeD (DUF308 family)|nr:hypothetical protein [Thermoleophilaceae bacterium]